MIVDAFAGLPLQTAIRAGLAGLGRLTPLAHGASALRVHDFDFLGGPPSEAAVDALARPTTVVCSDSWAMRLERHFGQLQVLPRRQMRAPERWSVPDHDPGLREATVEDLPALADLSGPLAATDPADGRTTTLWHGSRLVAAAGAFARFGVDIEAELCVDEALWCQGLGGRVARGWLRACLQHGLRPHWDAANAASERIALRLGFRPGPAWEAFWLHG